MAQLTRFQLTQSIMWVSWRLLSLPLVLSFSQCYCGMKYFTGCTRNHLQSVEGRHQDLDLNWWQTRNSHQYWYHWCIWICLTSL